MFKPKTLDSILSSLTKTTSDLNDLIAHHGENIAYKQQRINSLDVQIVNHDAEKKQANDVLKNLEKLVKTN